MHVFLYIFCHNIIPIFIVILCGFFLNRVFTLDINTLSKINLYLFVPVFTFVNLYSTTIDMQMIKTIAFGLIMVGVYMLAAEVVVKLRGYELRLASAFKNAVMFYNSGNIGLPLITLVFSSAPYVIDGYTPYLHLAVTTQIMIMVVQNVTTNTVGVFNAGKACLTWQQAVKIILQMPTIYAIPLAWFCKQLPIDLMQTSIWPGLEFIRQGMVAVALVTLGAQLSRTSFNLADCEIYLASVMRLMGGPLLALIVLKVLHFEGVAAQTLMISSAVPTAVNTALIAVEFNNRPDFAAQTVMVSTLFSALTLTLTIYSARILFPLSL